MVGKGGPIEFRLNPIQSQGGMGIPEEEEEEVDDSELDEEYDSM
jgi:hypothetical protein